MISPDYIESSLEPIIANVFQQTCSCFIRLRCPQWVQPGELSHTINHDQNVLE